MRGTGPRASTHRVRSGIEGVRHARPATDTGVATDPRDGDREVLALVATPFTTVADAHRRLLALERLFVTREDRRAVFLSIYARVTELVGDAIDRGTFEDGEWVARYLVAFANLYRQALYDYETGDLDALSDPWQLAFEAAARGDCLVVQDAMLGINAHINYDLAFALHEAGVATNRRRKYADHCTVNEILRCLVDEAQDTLAADYDAPGITTVDESMGRLDEVLSIRTIREGRDSAWRNACALDSRWAVRRRLARWVTRVTATGAAHLLLSPNASSRVHGALREFEGRLGEAETTDDRVTED
ncbi:DUF5995 family protein [Haloarchaeobius amylolyticus]|uniref:DUF5995 family protein n=1 Tax=Haloarchaeobius amylolyticus TaxID=1198296 RepID=UPI00226EE521|nr:DUF5995 family protein [Haloarchaeobius amylolyticus]